MLKVSCQAAVTRFDRPAVLQCLYRVLVLAHHRLDCDAHTRHQTRTAPGVAEVRDLGVLMQLLADTVADKAADDREAVLLDIGLYCVADIPYPLYAEAGADAVIGGHPHRLQGCGFTDGVPVAYSLGNFWFSTGTLYTTLAKITITEDGAVTLSYVPCIQKGLVTSILTEQDDKDGFYHYLAAISDDIGMDADGNVYDKTAGDYPSQVIVYDSDTSKTKIRGTTDNDGYAIDIVGNRK